MKQRKKRQEHPIDESEIIKNVEARKLSPELHKHCLAFALRLNRLLDDKQVTQDQLAKKAAINPSSVSYYRNGERMPGSDKLIKIANSLDVSVDYLLGNTELLSNDDLHRAIHDMLGLNDAAISALASFNSYYSGDFTGQKRIDTLNYLLAHIESSESSLMMMVLHYLVVESNYEELPPIPISGITDDPTSKVQIQQGVAQNLVEDMYEKKVVDSLKKAKSNISGGLQ